METSRNLGMAFEGRFRVWCGVYGGWVFLRTLLTFSLSFVGIEIYGDFPEPWNGL
jgi:hypothetical protein